jgi:hypothetical protein
VARSSLRVMTTAESDTKPDDTEPDHTKPDHTKPDDTEPDDTEPDDSKRILVEHLGTLNRAILWKVEGLGDYDLRRPLTPTGTNALGLVKHLASVQAGYFGDVFGRPAPFPMPWLAREAPINADMWATPQESSASVIGMYAESWRHAEETFAVVGIEETGTVPWWPPERRHPTLRAVLVHVIVETARHAGHLDIVRELIDAQAGRFAGDASMPGEEEIDWATYRAEVQAGADTFREG